MTDNRAPEERGGGRKSTTARLKASLPAPGAPRALALSTLVGQTGSGLLLPVSALFFTRSVGLPVAQVGTGLAVAGLVGLMAAVPLGRLADRLGARGVYAAMLLGQAVATACCVLVHSLVAFVFISVVRVVAERGGGAARGALIATVGTGEGRVRLRALLKSVTNAGLSVGTALAGLALSVDTRGAYVAVILLNAAAYVLAALPLARVPAVPATRSDRSAPARHTVLRDRPYAVVTFLAGFTSIHYDVLSFLLPLWIAGHTAAPRWTISAVIVTNTVLVVFLQVPFSKGTGAAPDAAAVVRRSGIVLLVAWLFFALAGPMKDPWLSIALLFGGMILHTAGELWHSAGSYGLSYELAPEGSHGEYQGFFSLGRGTAAALAPAVLTAACLAGGPAWRATGGWLVLGIAVAAGAAAMPVSVQWALRAGRRAAPALAPGPDPQTGTASASTIKESA